MSIKKIIINDPNYNHLYANKEMIHNRIATYRKYLRETEKIITKSLLTQFTC